MSIVDDAVESRQRRYLLRSDALDGLEAWLAPRARADQVVTTAYVTRRVAGWSLQAIMSGVTTFVLSELEAAIRSSWSAETATPPNRGLWSATNPGWDQCGVTALVISDLLGGDLVRGEVHRGGERIDYHWWNRLGSGLEVDLTREQFIDGEQVVGKDVVARPPNERIVWLREEYELLSDRVRTKLGL